MKRGAVGIKKCRECAEGVQGSASKKKKKGIASSRGGKKSPLESGRKQGLKMEVGYGQKGEGRYKKIGGPGNWFIGGGGQGPRRKKRET